ncbi:Immunity protein 19 [Chitinophaga eiseniae]|uniref:Immunity protein 19 n=1 Tax=Chitinophaga eiseniae TaxID=634771 RepID=A0A1T4TUT8_9BACT|nr:Imm19 family immunity protein [Chitinophaga eiseniae]SKA44223.1 Immunity protein 19 [Chitinophaga eiseniae]
MQLDLSDKNFCLFLLTQFPFASDDETETMLTDYLPEHFSMPPGEWWEELTGKTAEPWQGYTYVHRLNETVTFFAEFHPCETIYFFNDTYLGNTGGNFHLSLLRWTELQTLVSKDETAPSLLFFLLLPLVAGNQSERAEIEVAITNRLKEMALDLPADQIKVLTRFLSSHLIFEEEEGNIFEHTPDIGWVINRNHSERNRQNRGEDLLAINQLIGSAVV